MGRGKHHLAQESRGSVTSSKKQQLELHVALSLIYIALLWVSECSYMQMREHYKLRPKPYPLSPTHL